jgi:hypothetical protein
MRSMRVGRTSDRMSRQSSYSSFPVGRELFPPQKQKRGSRPAALLLLVRHVIDVETKSARLSAVRNL